MPRGIPYIVGNEAAERFSFYGMRTILFIFMTRYLLDATGQRAVMSDDEAKEAVHWFVTAAYFFPIVGAIFSDAFLGKYRTIVSISIVYCLGHLTLALDQTRVGLAVGLGLIAIGTGAIKPCVSAHVGDQFGTENQHLLSKVFAWFYFSINLGAFISTLLTPLFLEWHGPHVAFGVPGVLMLLATIIFWAGRYKFVHVPAAGMDSVKGAFSSDGLLAIKYLVPIYVLVAMFWSLFDQTGSAWIQQAKRMDRHWLGVDWLPSQIQAANPLLILAFIPLFTYVVYPAINRVFPLTPLRKVSIGFFITILAFGVPTAVEQQITGGQVVHATSEGDIGRWPVENLLDGKADGTGWVSEKGVKFPQEIILRLRERRAWSIHSVRIKPQTNLLAFLQEQAPQGCSYTDEDASRCQVKDVEILVGGTRKGPWELVGQLAFSQDAATSESRFDPVLAEYVLIRVPSNWGGDYVGLGEIEVNTARSLAADLHPHARDVFPNVAAVGYQPNIVWQLFGYVLMTAAEIMISITCLEFSYTQAPNKMKSIIMSLYMLSVAAGNAFTASVNGFIQNDDGSSKLEGADYYWFFTLAITTAAFVFIFVARNYRGQTYIQGQEGAVSGSSKT